MPFMGCILYFIFRTLLCAAAKKKKKKKKCVIYWKNGHCNNFLVLEQHKVKMPKQTYKTTNKNASERLYRNFNFTQWRIYTVMLIY